jgi:universal stress protein A
LQFADHFLGLASALKMAPQSPAKDAQHLPTAAQRIFSSTGKNRQQMKSQTFAARPPKLLTSITSRTNGHAAITIKKILVPTDFSPASRKAFKYALRLAEEFAAELTLLYVLVPAPLRRFASIPGAPAFSQSDLSGTEKNLRALIASTRNGSVQRVRSTMRIGLPSHEIVEMAKDGDIDLIVIATHGYTGWKHFCIGSTAERVVRAAPCPVLVVREKEHEFC